MLPPLFERVVERAVAEDGVVGGGEIGDDVGHDAPVDNLAVDGRGIADEPDDSARFLRTQQRECLVEIIGHCREVTAGKGAGALVLVNLDDEAATADEGDGERLGRAHASEPGRENEPMGERATEVLSTNSLQELVDALEHALKPDVLPVAGGQATPHHQTAVTQLVEVLRRRVVADDIATGHDHEWGVGRAREDRNRLARLHDKRLVLAEVLESCHDPGVGVPVPGGFSSRRVDDQVLGTLADLENVLEHSQDRFLPPAPTAQLSAALSRHDAVPERISHVAILPASARRRGPDPPSPATGSRPRPLRPARR